MVSTIGKADMIVQREQRIFTWVSYNFHISPPIRELEMTVFVIHGRALDEPIRRRELNMSLP